MRSFRSWLSPPRLRLIGLACAVILAGCQSQPAKDKREWAPVRGKVLAGDTPLAGALVTFHPDESKGNSARVLPMGKVRKDGAYELVSGANPGAPLGWYRVTLTSFGAPGRAAAPRIHPRYAQLDQTPLTVEVVSQPRPGQYDLRLSR